MRRTPLLMIAVLATALAGPAATAASAAPDDVAPNGQIAYAVSDCCASDIWVVNPDGTDPHNVTNTVDAREYDPAWSPDGTKILYTRYDDEFDAESDIWVMDADGSNQTRLTTSTDPEFQGDWSPDGTQIVYAAYTEGDVITSQADIFVMNADGTNQTNITQVDTDEIDPAWSPDGDRIAFAGVRVLEDGGYWELVTMDPDGTDQVELTVAHQPGYEDRYPDWSPDGEMIVWMAQENEPCCGVWDIWAMNEDGSGQTLLTGDYEGTDWFPSWSPDGIKITFTSYRDSQFGDLYTMDAPTVLPPPTITAPSGGANVQRITHGGHAANPSWGPAGFRTATVRVTLLGGGTGTVRSSDGSINCGTDCTGSVRAGSTMKLKAKQAPGSVFAGWSGACTGTATTCVVTADQSAGVKATFRRVA